MLAKNFSVKEFACKGNDCKNILIDTELVNYLQKIRDHFNKKVYITSGYRCSAHNSRVGGSKNSYHTKGMAVDIVIDTVEPKEVAKYCEKIGILGIGLYETPNDGYFVHIDTRKNKSFWYGQKQVYKSSFYPENEYNGDCRCRVKSVQEFLNKNGNYNLEPDGIFGIKTEKALADYHSKNGLVMENM